MRVKFLTHCRDILTREHYPEGTVVDLPDARALDAVAKGHAELIEGEPKKKRGRPPKNKAARATEDK
jgi:hypothetical protein